MAEKHESSERSGGNGDASSYGLTQATEAVEKLRTVVDQASQSIKDLTQAGQEWAQDAQDVAQQLREQGGRAVATVSGTVEHNPLASMAVAFALGFVVASLIKR